MHMYTISDSDKETFRIRAIKGAQFYSKYLLNNVFAIVTDDYEIANITFDKKKFLHLAGLNVNVGENMFFDLCVNGILSRSNIKTLQRHNKATLKSKSKNIEKILHFIYADASTNLLLTQFVTDGEPNRPFPYAIENVNEKMVLAFASKTHKAKSLRKRTGTQQYKESKKIIGIFKINNNLWDECVYIRKREEILNNIDLDLLSDKLKIYLHV